MKPRYTPWLEPLRTRFYDLTWQEAKAFLREFVRRVPERIQMLEDYIKSSPGYEHWRADCSEQSFKDLGPWLLTVLRSRVLEREEKVVEVWNPMLSKESVEAMERSWKDQHVEEFLPESEALLVDCGIYFAECIRKQVPTTRWGRCKAKMDENCNFPLLELSTNSGLNPVSFGVGTGRALADGRCSPEEAWTENHEWWVKIAMKTEHQRAKWKKSMP